MTRHENASPVALTAPLAVRPRTGGARTQRRAFLPSRTTNRRESRSWSPADEARPAALRLLGGVPQIQEECREMRMTTAIESVFQDLRYWRCACCARIRRLRLRRFWCSALGVGANTAIFGVANAVLLRPLPLPEPARIVRLWDTFGTPGNYGHVSYPNFEDWRSWSHSFFAMAVFAERGIRANRHGRGGSAGGRLRPRLASSMYWA